MDARKGWGRVRSKSWIDRRAVGAGLVVLSAVVGGLAPPAPVRAATSVAAWAAKTAMRSDHDMVARGSSDCVDPGHCGGFTRSSGEAVRDEDLVAKIFALSWASGWNRWARAHLVPQQILAVGCRYLSAENYYLCAVRVSFGLPRMSVGPSSAPGTGCGLIVVSAKTQIGPNDRIVNGLRTTCHIFSTYPPEVVVSRWPRSPG